MLDTHAVVFLAENRVGVFGVAAKEAIRHAVLLLSPAVRLELAFLYEVGKLAVPPADLLGPLLTEGRIAEAQERFAEVVTAAAGLSWTRDPFDRLIAGHAQLLGLPLVSRDRLIAAHVATLW